MVPIFRLPGNLEFQPTPNMIPVVCHRPIPSGQSLVLDNVLISIGHGSPWNENPEQYCSQQATLAKSYRVAKKSTKHCSQTTGQGGWAGTAWEKNMVSVSMFGRSPPHGSWWVIWVICHMSILTVSWWHLTIWRLVLFTSSTAQGGGGSFKSREPIGEVGCCEPHMAERIHWWTERWLELCFLKWLQWLQWSPHPQLFDVVWCSTVVVVVVA